MDHRIRGEIGRAIKNLLPCNNKNNIVVGHRWTMEDGTRWKAFSFIMAGS